MTIKHLFAKTSFEEIRDILFQLVLYSCDDCCITNCEKYIVQPFIESYLATGGDVNIVDNEGLPLITALMRNNSDDKCLRFELVCKMLKEHKPRLDYLSAQFCPIIAALQSKSPVRAASSINFCNTNVPQQRMFFFIRYLLTIDHNLCQKNNEREWLHYVVRCPDVSVDLLELLLPYCDVNKTKKGQTLIYTAIDGIFPWEHSSHRTNTLVNKIIPKLIASGCVIENPTCNLPSPLLEANRLALRTWKKDHWSLVTRLIQAGADVNASYPEVDYDEEWGVDYWKCPGDTFLHRLLDLQRSDDYPYQFGCLRFDVFAFKPYINDVIPIARTLIANGANINATNYFDLTPLWNALISTSSWSVVHPVVRMLIQENADVFSLRPFSDFFQYVDTLVADNVYQWPNSYVTGPHPFNADDYERQLLKFRCKGFFSQRTMLGTVTAMGNIPLIEQLLLSGAGYATKKDINKAKEVVIKMRIRSLPWNPRLQFKTPNDTMLFLNCCNRVYNMLQNYQPSTLRDLARNVIRQTAYGRSPRKMKTFLPRPIIDILTLQELNQIPLIQIKECPMSVSTSSSDEYEQDVNELFG